MTVKGLLAEINTHMEELAETVELAESELQRMERYSPDPRELRIHGSILHDFYTIIEDVFEIVAKEIDGGLPQSSDWHQRLLNMMAAEVDGVRPAVVSRSLAKQLRMYLGFRHVFRNVYGHHLHPARLRPLLEDLPTTYRRLEREFDEWVAFLKQMEGA